MSLSSVSQESAVINGQPAFDAGTSPAVGRTVQIQKTLAAGANVLKPQLGVTTNLKYLAIKNGGDADTTTMNIDGGEAFNLKAGESLVLDGPTVAKSVCDALSNGVVCNVLNVTAPAGPGVVVIEFIGVLDQ